MKTIYYTFCLTATCAFVWLAVYAYGQRVTTLEQLIERSERELVEHKLTQLYGGTYDGVH
jgi:uncharacterized membrane protein YgcG